MGARYHRANPAKVRATVVQIDLTATEHKGLQELKRITKKTMTGLLREMLETKMREYGLLPTLLKASDFIQGEDAFLYPWSKVGAGHLPPSKMVWFSRKEGEWRTWEHLFIDMEHRTAEGLDAICARYDVSTFYAQRQFARYDRWRRGEDVYPQLDTLGAVRRARKQREGKKK